MTPLELDVMIHYIGHTCDHDIVARNPPIWAETRDWFLSEGLLEVVPTDQVRDAIYRLTPRGIAFVEALQSVPLPEQIWIVSPLTGSAVMGQRLSQA